MKNQARLYLFLGAKHYPRIPSGLDTKAESAWIRVLSSQRALRPKRHLGAAARSAPRSEVWQGTR